MIVGDYNYYFDGGAMLYALTAANQWRVSVLVDEAHNLVSRGRAMYSAELSRGALRAARAVAPPLLKKALDRVSRNWTELDKGAAAPYQVMPALPDKLLTNLQGAASEITEFLAENPAPLDPALQRFYFDATALRPPGRVVRRAFAVRRLARCGARLDPVHPQYRAGAVPEGALRRGPFERAVLRHAQSMALLQRRARHAGRHRVDRRRIAVFGRPAGRCTW